ncbi:DUF3800 domain-containing protein [Shimia sp. R11_0]|uniref:DUF3800 domain-containing protein n=1 Tax=Shimia sp. R11_0 TaxID=2821096 RepID=UPI001ADC7CA5|nr:DUF3800 domain-containing protein [Shimia sp. R11_0]MBO9476415.1 DUF3800 domain-containing protein [Shimia sp. R11_0]
MAEFSDFIIYLDESGSPALDADKDEFPVFVLACVCVNKSHYCDDLVPRLQALKFKYFGHDQIIFHERDIRRQSGDFVALRGDRNLRNAFLDEVTELISSFDFDVATAVIDKQKLKEKYPDPKSPYELSLLLVMEHLALMLRDADQIGKTVHVIAEARGKPEDAELELVFRRIANGQPPLRSNQRDLITQFDWQILFCDKKSNSSGLQLADLIARPIGLHQLKPEQTNRAYDVIAEKVAWWIKAFP